jgi:tripartite-type tricarboxylate transporter receptor subunit TctC
MLAKVVRTILVAALLAPSLPASAQQPADEPGYPSRPISLIVPYPPGGPNDVIARTIGPEMAQVLGRPVVIENRPGAGGNTATGAVARAPADGYTVLLPGIPYAVNPAIFDKVPYAFSDFRPVSVVARGALVLVTHPSLGMKTVGELIAAARAQPGRIPYASGGTGTSPHLAGELFKRLAGVDLLHVPYKGTADFMADLLAGRTPVAFASPLAIRGHVESGKLTALGVTSDGPLRGMDSWNGSRRPRQPRCVRRRCRTSCIRWASTSCARRPPRPMPTSARRSTAGPGWRGKRRSGQSSYFTSSSSTSNTRVAFGGITPPAPRAP